MSKEQQFILYSNDKQKVKLIFLFKIEKDSKITVRAKKEALLFPKLYQKSFTKDEITSSAKIVLQDEQLILQEIVSSYKSNKLTFISTDSEIILTFYLFNGSFKINLPIPLLKNQRKTLELAIDNITSKVSYLTEQLKHYDNIIRKLVKYFFANAKKINQMRIFDKPTLTKLLKENNNEIFQRMPSCMENFFVMNKKGEYCNIANISHKDIRNDFLFEYSKAQLIRVINTEKGSSRITSLCFLRDKRLVSCSTEKVSEPDEDPKSRIVVYKIDTYEPEIIINGNSAISSVCALRNGNLASSFGQDIKIWEILKSSYKAVLTLKGHSDTVTKIIEINDGKICSCSSDKTIKVWDNGQCIRTLEGHKDTIRAIVEINNDIISVSGICENNLKIWSKTTYECLITIKDISCNTKNTLSKLKDNTVIVGGYKKFYMVDTLSFITTSFEDEKLGGISSICVLKNGKVLLGNWKGLIICFDSLTNKIVKIAKAHEDSINCLVDGENDQLFSSSFDKTIHIYCRISSI